MPASNTYESISSVTLSNDSANVTFGSIPQTYTDLVVVVYGRSVRPSNYDDNLSFRFNSDTATNYSNTYMNATGSSSGSTRETSTTYISSRICASSQTSNIFTPVIIHINNYSNTTTFKTVINRSSEAPSAGADYGVSAYASVWRSTSAITNINFFPLGGTSFLSGSTFSLYGIKAA